MITVEAQIQAILDGLGIHLDGESFQNVVRALRIDRLSWAQKFGLAVALGAVVAWVRNRAKEKAKALAAAEAAAVR